MVSTRDLIGQRLSLALQRIFAGVNGIRHGGSEESIDAVRRQSSTWVTDRFTESADVPDTPFAPTSHRSVSASGQQAGAKKPTGRRSAQKCETDKQNNEHLSRLRELIIASGVLGVAVRKVCSCRQPKRNTHVTPFLSPREMPYWPSCLQSRCCQIDVVFVRGLRWDLACSLESNFEIPMDSTSPRTPLVEWSFLTSHPMFPLWVVQLLPTSPDLLL